MNTHNCPECEGAGKFKAAFKPIIINCPLCDGLGMVSDEILRWREYGRRYRARRIERRENMRECAKRLDIDVVKLSNAEIGKINPVGILI
jgi:RecJ-like exonuclease